MLPIQCKAKALFCSLLASFTAFLRSLSLSFIRSNFFSSSVIFSGSFALALAFGFALGFGVALGFDFALAFACASKSSLTAKRRLISAVMGFCFASNSSVFCFFSARSVLRRALTSSMVFSS